MPIQLTSNCCLASNASQADPLLGSLITFNELSSTQDGIEPAVVQLKPSDATPEATTVSLSTTAKTLLQLAPRNPAVALTVYDHEPPFGMRKLVVVSSARTIEVYRGGGDYLGTFQGEPWSVKSRSPESSSLMSSSPAAIRTGAVAAKKQEQGDDGRSLATAPLFRILVDSPGLEGPTRGVMLKFFIPKRPVAYQDRLTIQEINIMEAMLDAGHQHQPQHQPQPQQHHSLSQASTAIPTSNPLLAMSALASSHGGGIDLTKVRELMGDMRIDQLPPGARDLMQTVEQQSQLRQALASGTTVSTTAEESQLSSHRSHHSNLSHSPAPATMEPSASSTGPQSQALPSSGGGMTPPRAPSLSPQEDPYGTRSSGGESQFPQYQHQHRGSYSSIFSDSSVTSPLATGDPNQPVTREDLRLLESRIMHAIDRKISQLEERIMAKLYARNRL